MGEGVSLLGPILPTLPFPVPLWLPALLQAAGEFFLVLLVCLFVFLIQGFSM